MRAQVTDAGGAAGVLGDRVALLDVNVLVALAWPNHVHHDVARAWFDAHHRHGWATTPITESGFVRVSSNRAVLPTTTTPTIAIDVLAAMTALDGHEFWADGLSGVTGGLGDPALIQSHRDVTDAHLLALTETHGGAVVTFDTRMARLLGDRDPGLIAHPG